MCLAGVYGLTPLGVLGILNVALMETKMPRTRGTASAALSILLSISLLARPVLGNSGLVWGSESGSASATLLNGTAVFSTSRENAFVLHASTAAFKPRGDEPTVANVTLLNPKELVVRCSRGAVLIAVGDDVRVVPEGAAYHVVLDPEAALPAGAVPAAATPASWGQHQPIKTGKSKFIWYAVAFAVLVTGFGLWEALESP